MIRSPHRLAPVLRLLCVGAAAVGALALSAGCRHSEPAAALRLPPAATVSPPPWTARHGRPRPVLRSYDVRDLLDGSAPGARRAWAPADLIAWLKARTGPHRWGGERLLEFDRGELLVYHEEAMQAQIARHLVRLRRDRRTASLLELEAALR